MTRLFIILISLVVILVIGVFLIWPKYQELKVAQLKLVQKQVELENLGQYNLQLEEHFRKLQQYEKELAYIDFALPSDFDFPSLFHFLQKTCSQNGLVLKNIGPSFVPPADASEEEVSNGQAPQKKTIRGLATTLELSGSYKAFLNFLSALEKSARLIEVESISFSSPEGEDIFSFQLLVKAHSY